MIHHISVLTWCVIVLAKVVNSEKGPLVTTAQGQIRGTEQTTYGGKKVYAFLGIPYGAPPIGEGRFLRSRPAEPWNGILNATTNPVMCHQREYPFAAIVPFLRPWKILTNLSEDCLYLSVWTPIPKPQRAAVMVWIHGGAFTKGGISFPTYNGGSLAAEENIIVVGINYRLSVLGFLYLDDELLPGNAGLYDQLLALQWVRDNIEAFGGDAKSITVFGESCGAATTGLLLISPKNDVFNRGIMQSASPDAPWAIHDKEKAKTRALNVAKYVGCDNGDAAAIVKCLRSKNVSDLLEAEPDDPRGVSLAPVIDGELIVSNGSENWNGRQIEILIGTNANEGTLFFSNFFISYAAFFKDKLILTRDTLLDFLKKESPYHDKPGTAELVAYLYTDWLHPNISNSALDNVISDLQFTCPAHKMASAVVSSGGHAYMYRYSNRASYSLFPKWLGVFHSHEIEMIFGQPLDLDRTYSFEDRVFSQRMGRFWANFARTGDPNQSPPKQPAVTSVYWPKYTMSNKEYLTLLSNGSYPDHGLRTSFCVFWEDFLPNFLKQMRTANSTTD